MAEPIHVPSAHGAELAQGGGPDALTPFMHAMIAGATPIPKNL